MSDNVSLFVSYFFAVRNTARWGFGQQILTDIREPITVTDIERVHQIISNLVADDLKEDEAADVRLINWKELKG